MVHIFSNQKSKILWGLAMEDAGIFRGHLAYFMDIWSILWTIGLFYGHLVYFMDECICGSLVYFSPFWYVVPRKIWQPCLS
jgi:hypothetical protein